MSKCLPVYVPQFTVSKDIFLIDGKDSYCEMNTQCMKYKAFVKYQYMTNYQYVDARSTNKVICK